MWRVVLHDQPGVGPRMHQALKRLDRARARRLVEALRVLGLAEPWVAPSEDEWSDAVQLVDMQRAAPQSWFDLDGVIYAYMIEAFSHEVVMAHCLREEDPGHVAI